MLGFKSQSKSQYTDVFCQHQVDKHIICARPLTEVQVKWCKENKEKFGGKMLCYGHQRQYLEKKEGELN